jgi:uncharacterized protein YdeI (YjbR/CyaY-like superfamily)
VTSRVTPHVGDVACRRDATQIAKIQNYTMTPEFFATPSELRAWFERYHDKSRELWIGLYKKSSSIPSVTWPEAVDAALCFGWIDGSRKSIDEVSYTIRLTPRKSRSTWSAVNIKKARNLIKLDLMHRAGLKAFRGRAKDRSGIYSYEERRSLELDSLYEKKLRTSTKAYEFFQTQARWYQRTSIFWVMSAKKKETRLKRLTTLIACSQDGRTIKPLTRPNGRGGRVLR